MEIAKNFLSVTIIKLICYNNYNMKNLIIIKNRRTNIVL